MRGAPQATSRHNDVKISAETLFNRARVPNAAFPIIHMHSTCDMTMTNYMYARMLATNGAATLQSSPAQCCCQGLPSRPSIAYTVTARSHSTEHRQTCISSSRATITAVATVRRRRRNGAVQAVTAVRIVTAVACWLGRSARGAGQQHLVDRKDGDPVCVCVGGGKTYGMSYTVVNVGPHTKYSWACTGLHCKACAAGLAESDASQCLSHGLSGGAGAQRAASQQPRIDLG